jgi:histidyl-tRNA synthetase
MQTQALPGFRDFYPEDLALRAHIFETWRTVANRYGFEEYDGPPLEPLDLYTEKSGDEIVGQLYNFVDRGDRKVALRPEMTPTLARMVAARAKGLRKPIRWFSIPQLFRYERQQRGRLREHFQFNCDLIGEASPLADAEVIALAIDVMRAFGLTANDVRVRLSDRRLLNAMLRRFSLTEDQTAAVYNYLDKQGRTTHSRNLERLKELNVPDEVGGMLDFVSSAREMVTLEPWFKDAETRVIAGQLDEVITALNNMNLSDYIEVDLGVVRGLAYYTGTVFEVFDASRSMRAICGGGRYDNLLEAVGDVQLPAVGFGMGDVVLGELLKGKIQSSRDTSTVDLFLAYVTEEDLRYVLALAHQFRDTNLRVEYSLSPQALSKQMKLADARKARLAIVVGPDERARGELVLRDLRSGAQETVRESTVIDTIKTRIHG